MTSHLVHMPSHTFFRTGRYDDCIASNERAIAVDEMYISKCLVPYLPSHNKALYVACAMASADIMVLTRPQLMFDNLLYTFIYD